MSGKHSSVTSRFVSQTEIDASRSTSTPSQDNDYDPRSLFERLQAHKEAKDAKYDEMFKLSNQFRGIDEGESDFLAQVDRQRKEEEKQKLKNEGEELERFRAAKAGKISPEPLDTARGVGKVEVEEKTESLGNKEGEVRIGKSAVRSGKKKRKANSTLLGIVKKKPLGAATGTPKPTASVERASTPAKPSLTAQSSQTNNPKIDPNKM